MFSAVCTQCNSYERKFVVKQVHQTPLDFTDIFSSTSMLGNMRGVTHCGPVLLRHYRTRLKRNLGASRRDSSGCSKWEWCPGRNARKTSLKPRNQFSIPGRDISLYKALLNIMILRFRVQLSVEAVVIYFVYVFELFPKSITSYIDFKPTAHHIFKSVWGQT